MIGNSLIRSSHEDVRRRCKAGRISEAKRTAIAADSSSVLPVDMRLGCMC